MDGASSIQSADLSWLDKPDVFRVNRLDAHSDHRCYATQDEAERDSSGLIMPLDGTWKFKYSPNPQARPVGFHQLAEAPADFDDIAVPGHIEMAGYDKNQYINTMYPWEGRKYRRPAGLTPDDPGIGTFSDADDNPVGSYMRTFTLPEHMRGQRIHVVFEGVEQAFYLWLNGHFVGYAEDTFTPSEFDLTPYINETGANTIACEVFKRSTAAWIEDQDFFRFFGIFRPVNLVALPQIHLDGIGYFYPTLTATEEIAADTPRRNMKIKLKAIRFRSDQKLKNSIGLIKVKQLKKNFHSSKLSEVEIDMLLKEYFSTHQMMQRRDFQSLCGMVRSTAMIHIRRICREGKLQNIGLRNQPIYVPVPGFYGTSRDQPTLR